MPQRSVGALGRADYSRLMSFAPRLPAAEFLTAEQLSDLRERSTLRGLLMIAHAWALIAGSVALVAFFPNPLTFVLAVMIIGSRQLGLAILMHDGAHGCLAKDPDTNHWMSQWLCAYPVFAETRAYRRYHMNHHKRTQQEDDPDLILSAPFPITRASYRRKFLRDILGQTGYAQRKAQLLNAMGDAAWPWRQRLAFFNEKLGKQFLVNAILWTAMAAVGVWWAYPLLWLLPMLTWYMVVTRVRNIAEHAVVPDHDDPLRNTRTTRASWIERLFVAPYYVNYHLEHHLLFFVPCWQLPKLHAILAKGPLYQRMEVQPNYRTVLRMATALPDVADKRGALVSNARRLRDGANMGQDQASSGF